MPAESAGVKVNNSDVAGLHRLVNRAIVEMRDSQSNAVADVNEYDQARFKRYFSNFRSYMAWVTSQPPLDLPETAPIEYVLDVNPVTSVLENDAITDLLRLMEAFRTEVVHSQSARRSCGYLSFDVARWNALIDKSEAYVDQYIAAAQPTDLPESSPMRSQSAAGLRGI
jgi:hypothetical protein